MTTYTRQSTVSNAKSLDTEFDNIETKFGELDTSVGTAETDITALESTTAKVGGNGTANTGVTATETGNGNTRVTTLTFTGLALPDVADNAASAVGVLLYTLPAGAQVIKTAYFNVGLTLDDAVQTDTPDVGLGTVIATGSVATLDGTSTFEDILTGQTFSSGVDGTAHAAIAQVGLARGASAAKTIHLNAADTWADTTTQGLTATGTVVIEWVALA